MTFEELNKYAEINADVCQENDYIPSSLFDEYGVNRGLRDLNGEGVLTGLSRISKIVSKKVVNDIDFFSGFVYEMLGIPVELYTAVFAIARIAGWSAHRIEELTNRGKIIHPAYRSVMEEL